MHSKPRKRPAAPAIFRANWKFCSTATITAQAKMPLRFRRPSCGLPSGPRVSGHASPGGIELFNARLASRIIGQRRGVSRDQLDEVGLTPGAGLFEHAAKMRLDRRIRDAERRGDFGNASYLDDGE